MTAFETSVKLADLFDWAEMAAFLGQEYQTRIHRMNYLLSDLFRMAANQNSCAKYSMLAEQC